VRFGVYFYPWYDERRWNEAPRPYTPEIGLYDSTDPQVIRWQMDLIASCGMDYVVFELVPERDWCFDVVDRTIGAAIPYLRELGLRWSFLLDAFVVPKRERISEEMRKLIRHVEARGWTDGLVEGPTGRPLLLIFFPTPDDAMALRRSDGSAYEIRFPAYLPHWGRVQAESDGLLLSPWKECLAHARGKGITLFEALVPLGYISFFESSGCRSFDRFASIISGYDDRLLRRDPVRTPSPLFIPPLDGETLSANLERAAATGSEHVIVYGWNEYFEGATLEPTKEYGRRRLEVCRDAISAERNRPRRCLT
jgi:hypothetical protein